MEGEKAREREREGVERGREREREVQESKGVERGTGREIFAYCVVDEMEGERERAKREREGV